MVTRRLQDQWRSEWKSSVQGMHTKEKLKRAEMAMLEMRAAYGRHMYDTFKLKQELAELKVGMAEGGGRMAHRAAAACPDGGDGAEQDMDTSLADYEHLRAKFQAYDDDDAAATFDKQHRAMLGVNRSRFDWLDGVHLQARMDRRKSKGESGGLKRRYRNQLYRTLFIMRMG